MHEGNERGDLGRRRGMSHNQYQHHLDLFSAKQDTHRFSKINFRRKGVRPLEDKKQIYAK